MKILESLKWRYATKKFDPTKKLTEDLISGILEVLNLTPTSYGLQPLKFLHVKNHEVRKKLVEHSWNQKQVQDASDLIIICIQDQITEKDVDSYIERIANIRNEDINAPRFESFKTMLMKIVSWSDSDYQEWARKQAYIALGNLMTSCAVERIDACPMEGFDPKKYDETLNLREKGLHSVLVCPVGYRSENDPNSELAKVRKKHDEIVIEIV